MLWIISQKAVTKGVPSIPLHKGHQEYHHKARNQDTEDKVTSFQRISLAAYDMVHPGIYRDLKCNVSEHSEKQA